MKIQANILNPVAGLEGFFNIGSSPNIPSLNTDNSIPASGLVMLVVGNAVQLAVNFKDRSLAKFVYIDHRFPHTQ
jgi:hypothetical protein